MEINKKANEELIKKQQELLLQQQRHLESNNKQQELALIASQEERKKLLLQEQILKEKNDARAREQAKEKEFEETRREIEQKMSAEKKQSILEEDHVSNSLAEITDEKEDPTRSISDQRKLLVTNTSTPVGNQNQKWGRQSMAVTPNRHSLSRLSSPHSPSDQKIDLSSKKPTMVPHIQGIQQETTKQLNLVDQSKYDKSPKGFLSADSLMKKKKEDENEAMATIPLLIDHKNENKENENIDGKENSDKEHSDEENSDKENSDKEIDFPDSNDESDSDLSSSHKESISVSSQTELSQDDKEEEEDVNDVDDDECVNVDLSNKDVGEEDDVIENAEEEDRDDEKLIHKIDEKEHRVVIEEIKKDKESIKGDIMKEVKIEEEENSKINNNNDDGVKTDSNKNNDFNNNDDVKTDSSIAEEDKVKNSTSTLAQVEVEVGSLVECRYKQSNRFYKGTIIEKNKITDSATQKNYVYSIKYLMDNEIETNINRIRLRYENEYQINELSVGEQVDARCSLPSYTQKVMFSTQTNTLPKYAVVSGRILEKVKSDENQIQNNQNSSGGGGSSDGRKEKRDQYVYKVKFDTLPGEVEGKHAPFTETIQRKFIFSSYFPKDQPSL
eukprot:CAMPEP_0114343348 /NCGR_PEP_ID=MMETSP0101-20121206/10534_1 /TAXON_ID=38822 ORGANISM="Pteridomonas danica, Strain PT" /NCGR_SAMPLE_ID=MMETSP0101 /ASSEMBLY_ACC=CAM_ASM_000211 /LENGTH=613 /DNA_ID=CAMNT_0001478015 /DNA_START=191 /DNA_END=2032 /DNA_ORIENTATION=-